MCGIAGIFKAGPPGEQRALVERMLTVMARRGPDGVGQWEDEQLALGHRRLSIVDPSPRGAQPMLSVSGRYVVSFNGEILNHRELAKQWDIDPSSLRSSSDTELLLIGWERLGPAAPAAFVGPFAFALYDRQEQRLWLVRDRLGERPLFYHHTPGALTFASTLDALVQAPWIPRELDHAAVEELVALRYVLSPRTVLRELYKLPPGQMLTIDAAGPRIERWWSPQFGSHSHVVPPRRRRERVERFGELIERAVERCTISDRPIGLLMSDGIDSNTVAHLLEHGGHNTRHFTFRSAETASEQPVVSRSERTMRIDVPRRARIECLHDALAALSEPVGDGAALASWFVLREARHEAIVLLTGHGGDEVCGGYRFSQDRFRLALLHRAARWRLRLATAAYERYTHGAAAVAERRRALGACRANQVPAIARFMIHQPLPLAEVIALRGDPTAAERYLSGVDRLYAACSADENDLERMQSVLLRGFLSENILSFTDAIAMSQSVECRAPFLDRDLVEFSLALPAHERVGSWPGYHNTKRMLRRWATGRLDPAVISRRKHSFPYGALRHLVAASRQQVLAPLLDCPGLARTLPGLERWLEQPADQFRGPRDGTLWALLALSALCARVLPRS